MLRDKSKSRFIKNVFLYRGKGGVNYLSTVKENLNKKKVICSLYCATLNKIEKYWYKRWSYAKFILYT